MRSPRIRRSTLSPATHSAVTGLSSRYPSTPGCAPRFELALAGDQITARITDPTQVDAGFKALNNLSLAIEPGELRAIIGPNGAGKTTFFNLVSGLFAPTAGSIKFDGRDVTALPPEERVRRGMARTFQITEIFPELPVADNIRVAVEIAAGYRLKPWLGAAARAVVAARVDELLDMGGLSDKSNVRAGALSHGDQRAAEIMMSLALRPRLLMLDEPTAGMGDQETYDIARLIRRLHRQEGLTIMLIEHDMRVVFNLADRIMVLAEGRVLAEGAPQEIADSDKVQAAYLGKAAA